MHNAILLEISNGKLSIPSPLPWISQLLFFRCSLINIANVTNHEFKVCSALRRAVQSVSNSSACSVFIPPLSSFAHHSVHFYSSSTHQLLNFARVTRLTRLTRLKRLTHSSTPCYVRTLAHDNDNCLWDAYPRLSMQQIQYFQTLRTNSLLPQLTAIVHTAMVFR